MFQHFQGIVGYGGACDNHLSKLELQREVLIISAKKVSTKGPFLFTFFLWVYRDPTSGVTNKFRRRRVIY